VIETKRRSTHFGFARSFDVDFNHAEIAVERAAFGMRALTLVVWAGRELRRAERFVRKLVQEPSHR